MAKRPESKVRAGARRQESEGHGFKSQHQQSFSPMKYPLNTIHIIFNQFAVSNHVRDYYLH